MIWLSCSLFSLLSCFFPFSSRRNRVTKNGSRSSLLQFWTRRRKLFQGNDTNVWESNITFKRVYKSNLVFLKVVIILPEYHRKKSMYQVLQYYAFGILKFQFTNGTISFRRDLSWSFTHFIWKTVFCIVTYWKEIWQCHIEKGSANTQY